jgi:predicted SprT family Zn-dependent metalloprotease
MKLVMLCWNCGKEHEPRVLSSFDGPYKCECGGYVVSPSGKVQLKRVREPDTTYLCKQCGPGAELVAVAAEETAYGNDCPKGVASK